MTTDATPIDQLPTRTWIAGLDNIARYMGWPGKARKVIRMVLKYGFPIYRMPASRVRGWMYMTTVQDVDHWLLLQKEQTWKHVASLPGTQKLFLPREKRTPAQLAADIEATRRRRDGG